MLDRRLGLPQRGVAVPEAAQQHAFAAAPAGLPGDGQGLPVALDRRLGLPQRDIAAAEIARVDHLPPGLAEPAGQALMHPSGQPVVPPLLQVAEIDVAKDGRGGVVVGVGAAQLELRQLRRQII